MRCYFSYSRTNRQTTYSTSKVGGTTASIIVFVIAVHAVATRAVDAGATVSNHIQGYVYRQATIIDLFVHEWLVEKL